MWADKAMTSKVKEKALKVLNCYSSERLEASVEKASKQALLVFFSAVTHKADVPFRVAGMEKGTWKINVS